MSEILLVNKSDVVAIADAAREKAGIDDKLTLSGIVNTIDSIGAGDNGIDIFEANKHININWNINSSGDNFFALDNFYIDWYQIDSETGKIIKEGIDLSQVTSETGVINCLPLCLELFADSSSFFMGQAWIDSVEIVDENTGDEITSTVSYSYMDGGNMILLMFTSNIENYDDITINIYYSIG